MNNEIPYYVANSGTKVYGSNRPGHSAWQMFDRAVADGLKPSTGADLNVGQLIKDSGKYLAMGVLGAPIVFIVLYHMVGLPGIVAWPVFWLMLLGIPFYGYKQITDEVSDHRHAKIESDYQYEGSAQQYEQIVSAARAGKLDKNLPAGVASWAIGALSEEKIGVMLESLGPDYEVSHDITILQDGTEVANIDHLVSTGNGVVMVDSKSWSGTVTVDQETGELTSQSGWNDTYRRKAIHSLRREAESLGLPLRAVVIAVDKGQVVGQYNGQQVEGVARILDDFMFDTYIVEVDLLHELMALLSEGGSQTTPMPDVEQTALSQGSEVQF